jgi:hypothetical protein
VVVDNPRTPLIHLLKVEGCLVHILVAQTPTFPAHASRGLVCAIPFRDLSTSYEPCLQFRWLGESATIAWWRYSELISTANLIAYSDGHETVACQTAWSSRGRGADVSR